MPDLTSWFAGSWEGSQALEGGAEVVDRGAFGEGGTVTLYQLESKGFNV